MQDSRTPTFSSPELQKAVTDARPILEGVDEARNRVSDDIKTLEAYLQGLDLKSSFRHPLGKCFVDPEGEAAQYVAASLEASGSASGGIAEEPGPYADTFDGDFSAVDFDLGFGDEAVDFFGLLMGNAELVGGAWFEAFGWAFEADAEGKP